MSKQKIVFPELFVGPTSSLIQTHPTDSSVFAATGDDQLKLCRFDWEKGDSAVFEQNGMEDSIGCISFNNDGSRINCALRSTLYSMDSEVLTKAVDKRVFTNAISCISSFSLVNQSYNLVIGDDEGDLHLVDTREATSVKDRVFKSRTQGVSISSMAVDNKLVYLACENGIIEVFDLKKRAFIMDYEFGDKMLMHIFVDGRTPVVSTDEGEVFWVDVEKGQVLHKTKQSDLMPERVTPISDDYALVKSMGGDNLALLSTAEYKFLGEGSTEPAFDVASTCDNEQIVVGLDRHGNVDVEIWETRSYLQTYVPRTNRTNGNADNGFFSGLDGDADEH